MSHFAVMVIGPDVEKQLAPYHEFECTGYNDQYVQDVDVTEECREKGLDWYGLEDKTVTSEADIDKNGEHEYGYAIIDADGNLIKAVNRTNPNRKWDWYQIGGRWSGFLKLKKNGVGALGSPGVMGSCFSSDEDRADIVRKGDIDFEGMRAEAEKTAAERWDKAAAAHKGARWETWETVREKHPGNIEAARAEYHAQPARAAVSDAFDNPWDTVDEYLTPRDEYIQQARDRATVLYALVKDGQWFEKGEMGWWGMSSNEMPQAEWNRKVNALIDSLPDDALITIVDCHI